MRFYSSFTAVVTAALSLSHHCIAFDFGFGKHHPVDYYTRNLKTISSIYNLTVFPSMFSFSFL